MFKVDQAIVTVESPDGSNKRKVGMMGVLSNTSSLYKPGAFGGATIEDPWECMARWVLRDISGFTLIGPAPTLLRSHWSRAS